jgi:hypothetical protein
LEVLHECNKPVGDGDHYVLGMGSFGGNIQNYARIKYQLQGLNTDLVYFGIKKSIEEKKGVNIGKYVEKK